MGPIERLHRSYRELGRSSKFPGQTGNSLHRSTNQIALIQEIIGSLDLRIASIQEIARPIDQSYRIDPPGK
jgi:hypothetical protein